MAQSDSTPSVIRAALRGQVLRLLPEVVDIVLDEDQPAAARVRAFETIARYGMGVADQAAVHVHAEGNAQVGVVIMPALGQDEDSLQVQDAEVIAIDSAGPANGLPPGEGQDEPPPGEGHG